MTKFQLYFNTIRYLKFIQVFYQVYYLVKRRFQWAIPAKSSNFITSGINFPNYISKPNSYRKSSDQHVFKFLNIEHHFCNEIDWELDSYGKLWAYNLNYFDFLVQKELEPSDGLNLILKYCDQQEKLNICFEPYTISRRGMNWIVFLSVNGFTNHQKINEFLLQQYVSLSKNIEYHILGNHILENGFSLLFAAVYFNNISFYNKSKKIIDKQLQEQILKDGAHFERSPMYHQIILQDLLDCINLLKHNPGFDDPGFEKSLVAKAASMLSWLWNSTFQNGMIPLVNDSAQNVSSSTSSLSEYARWLNINNESTSLKESGYRMRSITIGLKKVEMFIDVGDIGPDYQPGHGHSDTFSFLLNVDDLPVIVDTGTSTYERNQRRIEERSTAAHNTVRYGHYEQSEVWSSFRVAKRAKINYLFEDKNVILATHDGYSKYGVYHSRSFTFRSSSIIIKDEMEGDMKNKSTMYLHFHPSVPIELNAEFMAVSNHIQILFNGYDSLRLIPYKFAAGFNLLQNAISLEGVFENVASFEIKFDRL